MSDATGSTFTPAPLDDSKRTWLIASSCAGAVGAVALATPFVESFSPSEKAKAAGAPVEADLSDIAPGQMKIVAWRGKPVWILNRTKAMLETLKEDTNELADPHSERTALPIPPYAKNDWRSIKPEWLVVIGICTHLGCSPVEKFTPGPQPSLPSDWRGGFFCPCHGSTFDLAARVFKNKPAPDNLEVPRYMFLSDTKIVIGKDEKGEA